MTTEQYRQTILKTLKKYATTPHRYQNVESKLIVSDDRNDYLIMIYGAHNSENIHKCIFHLQIKDSKIIILRDNTQSGIFNKLIDAGLNGDRIIYSDISQYEIKDLDLTLSLEKIYEEHKSLFEVGDNFTKVIKPDITAADLVKLASIGHKYINCAIAQHLNTPSSLLMDLFIKFPVQVLTNPILDLLLLEQTEFIDNIHDTYSRYFRSKGLDKSSDIRKWAVKQKMVTRLIFGNLKKLRFILKLSRDIKNI